MPDIYQPAEDSYLLSETLASLDIKPNMTFLDMGSGSGIQAETMIKQGIIMPQNVTIVDINPEAIYQLKKGFPKSEVKKSNLFKALKGRKFDIVAFNPPYLPEDSKEPRSSQLATTGGPRGSELINEFIYRAKKHVTDKGKVILLTSNLTKGIKWLNWKKKLLAKKKLFMEELYIWELTR